MPEEPTTAWALLSKYRPRAIALVVSGMLALGSAAVSTVYYFAEPGTEVSLGLVSFTKQSTKESEINLMHRQLVAGAAIWSVSIRVIRECNYYEFEDEYFHFILNLDTNETFVLHDFDEPIFVEEAPLTYEVPNNDVAPGGQDQEAGVMTVTISPSNPLELEDIIMGLGLLRVACDKEA